KKRPPSSDAFEVAFSTLMSTKECAAIVQVGANDGTLNDPLHPMLRKFSARTKILLIEPQPTLIARLSENYKFHPDATIHNGAVGINRQLALYSLSEAAWADLDIPYAKEWPIYRAPPGVTSASRK